MASNSVVPARCGYCTRCQKSIDNPLNDIIPNDPRHFPFKDAKYTDKGKLDLEARCFTAAAIIAGFTSLFPPTTLQPLQHDAHKRWHAWMSAEEATPNSTTPWTWSRKAAINAESLDLNFFFTLFDDYFFRGALQKWTRIEWVDYASDPDAYGSTKADSEAEDESDVLEILEVLITITRPPESEGWDEKVVRRILETILHEIAHAIFRAFRCRCVDCECTTSLALTIGMEGHGPLWVELAQAIETVCELKFRGWWDEGEMIIGLNDYGREEEVRMIQALMKSGEIRETQEIKDLLPWLPRSMSV